MKAEITKHDYIGRFREAFKRGIDGMTEAAQVYVAAIDEDTEWHDRFRAEIPDLPPTVWVTLERVGRGMVHPRLLFGGVQNASKISRLPLVEQSRIVEGKKVDYVTPSGDVLKVDVRTLPKEQAEQVIGTGHIRSVAEQRALMMKPKADLTNDIPDAKPIPYYISGGKVTFRTNVTMTIRELANIMKAMRE